MYPEKIPDSRSLIRIFNGRILDSQGCKVYSCGLRRLWSDCTDAQADLSLRRAHMLERTANSRYIEVQGTFWNTSRYPYLDI